jgi:hypothetical protein
MQHHQTSFIFPARLLPYSAKNFSHFVHILPAAEAVNIRAGGDPSDWRSRNISVARYWNEVALHTIRMDASRAPVHSRNLFHLSVVMWNAWAAYAPLARQYQLDEKISVVGWSKSDINTARFECISFAAYGQFSRNKLCSASDASFCCAYRYTLLKYRFSLTTLPQVQSYLDARLAGLGLNKTLADASDSAANLGVRLAEKVINTGKMDVRYAVLRFHSPILTEHWCAGIRRKFRLQSRLQSLQRSFRPH